MQPIFQFSAEYGPDFAIGPGDQLVIKQSIWSERDPHCCPTQTRALYYAWNVAERRFRRGGVEGLKPIATER